LPNAGHSKVRRPIGRAQNREHGPGVLRALRPALRVSPVGTMASAHVCASLPNFLICEWHWINYLELWRSFAKEGKIISNGYITVTDRPGFGLEMNEEAARKA
jgi:L-alanine-DL-glutamate epimerase-like enolase superfamily enzyme